MFVKQLCLYCSKQPALLGQHKCAVCGGDMLLHNELKRIQHNKQCNDRHHQYKQAFHVKHGHYYRTQLKRQRLREEAKLKASINSINSFISKEMHNVSSSTITTVIV